MIGQGVQRSATVAGGAINRFVDPTASSNHAYQAVPREREEFWSNFGSEPSSGGRRGPAPDKEDFWNSFGGGGGGGEESKPLAPKKPSGIGTSAMKKTSTKKDDEDGWGAW